MKTLLTFIILIVSTLLFALFSDKANEESRGYIAKFIEKKIDKKVSIEEYKLDSDYIRVVARIDKNSMVKIYGAFDILSQKFNLNYAISSTEQPIDINGTAKGSIDNIFIEGGGDALSSKLNYKLEFKEQMPQNIQVDIKNAKLEEVLALAKEPIYAKGLFDLHIDMPKIDKNGGVGDAELILHKSRLDSKIFLEKMGIVLPINSTVEGVIKSKLSGVVASIDGDIRSTLAHLILKDGTINLETQALFSKFILDIKELKDLQSITKTNLKGALRLTGDIERKERELKLSILTKSLGGELSLLLLKDSLSMDMKNIESKKLLSMLNQPKYLDGQINSEVRLRDLENPKGTISLFMVDGLGVNSVLNKELDLELTKPLRVSLNIDGTIKEGKIISTTKIDSTLLTLLMENSLYDIKESKLDTKYILNIADLSKLDEFARKPLLGSMKLSGEIKNNQKLLVRGTTESFDGNIDFTLIDNKLKANIKEVPLKRVLYTLKYPLVFTAPISGVLDYDIKVKKGKLIAQLPNARVLKNQLTELVKQFGNIDLTDDVYNETTFNANIDADIIDFKFLAKSKQNEISLYNAKLNKHSNRINAKYRVFVDKKDVVGTIKGDVNSPSVTIDGSNFVKNRLKTVVKKYINSDTEEKVKSKLKDFGLDDNESKKAINRAKKFLKGFF